MNSLNSHNRLMRIYWLMKVGCFFVIYFVLGCLNSAVAFAQDYMPTRNNEDDNLPRPEKMVTKYGVGVPRYIDLETGEKVKIEGIFDSSSKRRVAMYGVAPGRRREYRFYVPRKPIIEIEEPEVTEESKSEDSDKSVKEEQKERDFRDEVIGAYGVVPPAEEQETTEEEK